jgi:hypothetical protein
MDTSGATLVASVNPAGFTSGDLFSELTNQTGFDENELSRNLLRAAVHRPDALLVNSWVDDLGHKATLRLHRPDGYELVIDQFLTVDEEEKLRSAFRGFKIKWTRQSVEPHGFAHAHRLCEYNEMLRSVRYSRNAKPSNHRFLVKDIGGNWYNHLVARRNNVHSCCPILDIRDGQRECERMYRLDAMTCLDAVQSEMAENLDNYRCSRKGQECYATAETLIFVHSVYDMTSTDVANCMASAKAKFAVGSMIFSPEILVISKGTIPVLNCEYEISYKTRKEGTIRFSFVNDSSLVYEHDLEKYLSHIKEPVLKSDNGNIYLREMTANKNGIQFFKIVHIRTTIPVGSYKLTQNFAMPDYLKEHVYIRYYDFDDKLIGANDRFKMVPIVIRVHRTYWDYVYQYALALQDGRFVVQNVIAVAVSGNSHVIVNGMSARTPERNDPDDVSRIAYAAYFLAFVRKHHNSRVLKNLVADENLWRSRSQSGWFRNTLSVIRQRLSDAFEFQSRTPKESMSPKPYAEEIVTDRDAKLYFFFSHLKRYNVSAEHLLGKVTIEKCYEVVENEGKLIYDPSRTNDVAVSVKFMKEEEPAPITCCDIVEAVPHECDKELEVWEPPADGMCVYHSMSRITGAPIAEICAKVENQLGPEDVEAMKNREPMGMDFINIVAATYGVSVCVHHGDGHPVNECSLLRYGEKVKHIEVMRPSANTYGHCRVLDEKKILFTKVSTAGDTASLSEDDNPFSLAKSWTSAERVDSSRRSDPQLSSDQYECGVVYDLATELKINKDDSIIVVSGGKNLKHFAYDKVTLLNLSGGDVSVSTSVRNVPFNCTTDDVVRISNALGITSCDYMFVCVEGNYVDPRSMTYEVLDTLIASFRPRNVVASSSLYTNGLYLGMCLRSVYRRVELWRSVLTRASSDRFYFVCSGAENYDGFLNMRSISVDSAHAAYKSIVLDHIKYLIDPNLIRRCDVSRYEKYAGLNTVKACVIKGDVSKYAGTTRNIAVSSVRNRDPVSLKVDSSPIRLNSYKIPFIIPGGIKLRQTPSIKFVASNAPPNPDKEKPTTRSKPLLNGIGSKLSYRPEFDSNASYAYNAFVERVELWRWLHQEMKSLYRSKYMQYRNRIDHLAKHPSLEKEQFLFVKGGVVMNAVNGKRCARELAKSWNYCYDHQVEDFVPFSPEDQLDDLVMVGEYSKLCQDGILYLACRDVVVSKTFDPKAHLEQGVPGCGKTTSIVNSCVSGDLIIASTTNNADDIKTKLSEKMKTGVTVLTVDSYLINHKDKSFENGDCYVDESLMQHAGSIVMMMVCSLAKKYRLYGDILQIPFVNRCQSVGAVRYELVRNLCNSMTVKYISYRCSKDVCDVLSPLYVKATGKPMVSFSGLTNTCTEIAIRSLNDVPRDSNAIYLTFKQSEKQQLSQHLGSNYKVKSVHEFQGGDENNVIIVRLSTVSTDRIFFSPTHSLVSFSRHKKSLRLYSINGIGTISEYIKQSKLVKGDGMRGYVDEPITFPTLNQGPAFHRSSLIKEKEISRFYVRSSGYYHGRTSRREYVTLIKQGRCVDLSALREKIVSSTRFYQDLARIAKEIGMTVSVEKNHRNELVVSDDVIGEFMDVNALIGPDDYTHTDYTQADDIECVPILSDVPFVDDGGAAVQHVVDDVLPGSSMYDGTFDTYQVHHSDIDLKLKDMKVNLATLGNFYDKEKGLLPVLRTPCPAVRPTTAIESIMAIMKRNLNKPELDEACDTRRVASVVKDVFVETYLTGDTPFPEIDVNASMLREWLKKQPPNIIGALQSDVGLYNKACDVFKFSIKAAPKIKIEKGSHFERQQLQTIVYWEKFINMAMCPIVNKMKENLWSRLKTNFLLYNDMSPKEFADKFTSKLKRRIMRKYAGKNVKLRSFEADISKFDKSQGELHLDIECALFEFLGMQKRVVEFWRHCHTVTYLKDFINKIRVQIYHQRKSGDASTWFGNTIVTMAAIAVALYGYMEEVLVGMFSGDDSGLVMDESVLLPEFDQFMENVFNFECKQFEFEFPYFCSKFLISTINGFEFVPDPLKMFVKLGRCDVGNRQLLEEYRKSLRDLSFHMRDAALCRQLAKAVQERYKCDRATFAALCSVLSYVDDQRLFDSLFEGEGNTSSTKLVDY